MKINAIFDNGDDFATYYNNGNENKSGEVNLVYAESNRNGARQELKGLDTALELTRSNSNPTIICSFLPESYVASKFGNTYFALMAKKRVGFLRLPFAPSVLLSKYQELMQIEKTEDLLSIEINQMSTFDSQMGTIQHCVSSYFREDSERGRSAIAEAVVKARAVGAIGTDEEIAIQIRDFKYRTGNNLFVGKFFPGIFCDIQNTLIKDGKVNEKMLGILQNFSKTKPITLWTGATLEIESIKADLVSHNILWRLIPKEILYGAEVEIAYDDEELLVLTERYGFKVRDFVKV